MNIKGRSPVTPANKSHGIAGIAEELSGISCVSYLDDLQLSDGLQSGSIKSAAVIACSDMGCSVPYVCSSPSAQLFLFQNIGHSFSVGGFVGTILKSGVENIIVYGHSGCEYTKFRAGSVRDEKSNDALQSTDEKQQFQLYCTALESNSETLWEEVGQYNVLFELKQMLADPEIKPLAAQGKLRLHGWYYKSACNQLEVFDPRHEAFTAQHIKS